MNTLQQQRGMTLWSFIFMIGLLAFVVFTALKVVPVYMEDFSVIGLRVDDCDHAVRILDQYRFDLKRADGSIEVYVDQASRMHEVMQLLENNGLGCELADVAEGIYQG